MKYANILCLWLLLSLPLYGQISQYSGSNSIVLELSSEETKMVLESENMLASYESSVGYFKLVVPFDDLQITKGAGKSRKLYKRLRKDMEGHSLVIWIYIKDRPLALGNFEGDGVVLPARIGFGELSFKNTAQIWGQTVNDHMIMRMKITNYLTPSAELHGSIFNEIDLVEIYSRHFEIYNFLDLLN